MTPRAVRQAVLLFAAGVVLLAAAITLGAAQQPTFRSGVAIVRIEVVAVTADGRAVHGLTKDDFTILDRGKPHAVVAIDEVTHPKQPESLLLPTLRLDVASNATARSDRLIILILDDLRFRRDKTDDVKRMARRVIEEIGPQASLGMVTTSGSFGIEPTEDRAQLLAELDRFVDKYEPDGRKLAPGAKAPKMPDMKGPTSPHGAGDHALGTSRGPGDLASFFADMTQQKSIGDVAKHIMADDGRRKSFVWITGGSPMNLDAQGRGPGQVDDTGYPTTSSGDWSLTEQAGMLEALRKANVSTYAITTGDFPSALPQKVADESGGFVIWGRDFDAQIGTLIDELDHFYVLGFTPDDPNDTSYHPLEVRTSRPGVTVRYRQGYQANGAAVKPMNKDPLAQLSEHALPMAALPLRLSATALLPASGNESRVAIALETQAPSDALAEEDFHLRDSVTYTVWAIDLDKKKEKARVGRSVAVALSLSTQRRDTVYQMETTLALPPGRYQLRASAESAKLKIGGSVFLQTDVPDFTARDVELGGIALAYAFGPRVPTVGTRIAAAALPIEPTLDRVFTPADTLRVVCDIATHKGIAPTTTITLIDNADWVVKTIDQKPPVAGPQSRIDATVALKGLLPGGYRLRVDATGGKDTARREVGFLIR